MSTIQKLEDEVLMHMGWKEQYFKEGLHREEISRSYYFHDGCITGLKKAIKAIKNESQIPV